MSSTKKDLLALNRKEISAPSGLTYIIRKISAFDYIRIAKSFPDVDVINKPEYFKNIDIVKDDRKRERMLKMADDFCILAVKNFNIKGEPLTAEEEKDDLTIHITDLTDTDKIFLLNEIMRFSGQSQEEAEKIVPFAPAKKDS